MRSTRWGRTCARSLSLPTSVASTFCVDYHRVQIQNEIEQCNKEIDEMYKAKEEDIMGG